jgi:DNA polymerase III subunit beta
MKLAANGAVLGHALALCTFQSKKPVLAQLAATDGAVTVTAGDGNISIKAAVDATIFEPGNTAVSADRFGALINAFEPGAAVTLTAIERALVVASGAGRYRLPLAEAPAELAITTNATAIEIMGADMLKLFEPLPAAGTETTRYYLCGIFLHSVDGLLYGVGTNGVSLLRTCIKADDLPAGSIIPSASITIAARLIKRTRPDKVTLRRAGTFFEISTERFTLTTRLINETYPDYARVIPNGLTNSATCDTTQLTAALARLSAIARADDGAISPLVGLTWTTAKPIGLYLLRQPDDGIDAIAAETVGPARIALSLRALATLVAEFRADRLSLAVDEGRALIIRTEGKLAVLTACRWNFGRAAAPAD